jgi:exonuclease III
MLFTDFSLAMNLGNLSLLCWNVRGISDPSKCVVVKDFIRDVHASIICIQETKLSEISLLKFNTITPHEFTEFAIMSVNGSRGGTLIAWTSSYTLNTSYILTFSNTVVLTNNLGTTFMLTNVYGPTSNNLKDDFLTEIRMVACLHDLPWILLGDFNLLRDTSESTSYNPNIHRMIEFNDMIDDLDLNEIQLFDRSFTWSNKRPNPSFSKLDIESSQTIGTP